MKNDNDVSESTLKSRRRVSLLNAIAKRLLNDPKATWSNVATKFTQALLEEKQNTNLTEGGIREIISGVLFDFAENNRVGASQVKSPADVKAALSASRGRRGRK